jgi:hypothetical protein
MKMLTESGSLPSGLVIKAYSLQAVLAYNQQPPSKSLSIKNLIQNVSLKKREEMPEKIPIF